MKIIQTLLLASALAACSGGRDAATDEMFVSPQDTDPYAEARALFEARQEMRRRAGEES